MSDFEESPASRAGGCMMQVLTHGVALVLGAVVGVVGANLVEYFENPDVMARPEGELSRADLIAKLDESEKKYAELLAESQKKDASSKTEVETAQTKVTDLEAQIKKKEDEVKVLQLKVKKGAKKSAALEKELAERQAELDALVVELDTAKLEVVRLQTDLDYSREETRVARSETSVARTETYEARWEGFKSDAMVSICEKGNRNKLAKCKDEVRAAMDSSRGRRFKHCLASGQATPRMVKVDKKEKDIQLPRWSEWVSQESKFTEDSWYVVFCDPSLPEASTIAEPTIAPSPPVEMPDVPDVPDVPAQ
jgi:predicted  nucleic acid-binding Zn-ribbon protein